MQDIFKLKEWWSLWDNLRFCKIDNHLKSSILIKTAKPSKSTDEWLRSSDKLNRRTMSILGLILADSIIPKIYLDDFGNIMFALL